jgi:hypothetical protein
MCQGDVMAATKVNHGFGIECYKLSRAIEPSKGIGFKKFHNHFVSIIPSGHKFDPFGKVVIGSEDPLMFPTGGSIHLTYEI